MSARSKLRTRLRALNHRGAYEGEMDFTPRDPLTLAVSIGAVAILTVFSAYLPAQRAANVDPMVALRYE